MLNQTPNRAPFAPLHPKVPELTRDSQGNVFYRETDGTWRPHNGPLPESLCGQVQGPAQAPLGPQSLYHIMNDKSHGGPDSPIAHAFNQDQYQFTLHPLPTNTAERHHIPIDPALIALLGDADLDLRHGPTIVNARRLKPVEKTAGSRRKAKGKERADPKGKKRQRNTSSGSEDDSEPAAKRGHPAGSVKILQLWTNKVRK
ncbi:hypothetical protein DFH07DRAFT_973633 [Mycena maculata]|uniref:Uncharacterized protein n=1 Tax=Mycena maculata TaxID=230809 RepID=A0AAD7HDI2_9AGAR|nr:hypothetical protein DFH07DRAFT_973633 [Mycena maculata]